MLLLPLVECFPLPFAEPAFGDSLLLFQPAATKPEFWCPKQV